MEARLNGKFVGLFRKVRAWVAWGDPPILILYGPPGVGKTESVLQAAAQHGSLVVWIAATRTTSLELLLGFWELRNGQTVFVEGELLRGLKTPNALIVIDDAHLVAPELQMFNGLGDSTRLITVPTLGRTERIADGVRLVLIANPPPRTVASWDRDKWIVPEQIRDRARVIDAGHGLTAEEEFAIARLRFPADQPDEVVRALVELVRNLRSNGVLTSYPVSLRSVLIVGKLLAQGCPLGEAYLEAIANKFVDQAEYAVAIEAFIAKFGVDPRDGSSLKEG